jgi:hypothetical protein
VIIISGHRRRAAIRKLVEDGREDLRKIPCIRETGEGSAALQELRLIYANSDTRKLSDAEISKQAERVEALLYQLKEEGYEFPGRMRDHVAEACKVSASKLARLKVIRDGLIESFSARYEQSQLAEQTAYTLARLPQETQQRISAQIAPDAPVRNATVERLIQTVQAEPQDEATPSAEPQPEDQKVIRWVPLRFQCGRPYLEGPYYCRFGTDGASVKMAAWWDGDKQVWRVSQTGIEISYDCMGWFPLPEDN